MTKVDIRSAICAELERKCMSTNALAALVAGRVHRSHVYDFIAGRKDLSASRVNHLMAALGLHIVSNGVRSRSNRQVGSSK